MSEDTAVWPFSLRLIHWASAALVLGTLGLGAYMVQLVHDPAERFELTQAHKSIGIVVLALAVVRLCLRILTTAPKPEPATQLMLMATKTAHIALYALLVLMPVSGWLMATTTPVRVPTFIFGLVELPYPSLPDLPTYRVAHVIHLVSAILLSSLIALHVGAALIYTLLWRDRTLVRMWRKRRAASRISS